MTGDRLPPQLRGILVPRARLGVVDGVEVVATLVEVWDTKVVVRLSVVPSERTAQLQAEHDAALERDVEARRRGERADGWVHQPGELLLRGRHPALTDDRGTTYAWEGGSAGGTGTEWEAAVRFRPGAPLDARQLRYSAAVDEGDGELLVDLTGAL